jgi:hypothetical protein
MFGRLIDPIFVSPRHKARVIIIQISTDRRDDPDLVEGVFTPRALRSMWEFLFKFSHQKSSTDINLPSPLKPKTWLPLCARSQRLTLANLPCELPPQPPKPKKPVETQNPKPEPPPPESDDDDEKTDPENIPGSPTFDRPTDDVVLTNLASSPGAVAD